MAKEELRSILKAIREDHGKSVRKIMNDVGSGKISPELARDEVESVTKQAQACTSGNLEEVIDYISRHS
ncbi:MAG: hypothetical protein GF381_01635 [Candidatus Pacebacteria bacterium]|nr:hypothetical protein [Candidatus Paceibacterota bacterium]